MDNNNQNAIHPEKQKLSDAVDCFADLMKSKLYKVYNEKGWDGWSNKQNAETIAYKLEKNCRDALYRINILNQFGNRTKDDLIDTANLAMMLVGFCNQEGDDK